MSADLTARGIEATSVRHGQESRRWSIKARETKEWMLSVYKDLRGTGDLKGIVKLWKDDALDVIEAQGLVVDPRNEGALEQL